MASVKEAVVFCNEKVGCSSRSIKKVFAWQYIYDVYTINMLKYRLRTQTTAKIKRGLMGTNIFITPVFLLTKR
jgi:hypothetical protein